MKAKELARKLEISGGSLSEIETGKTLPSASTLASIHQNTDLNVGYVLTGEIADGKPGRKRVLMVEVDADVDLMILKRKKYS